MGTQDIGTGTRTTIVIVAADTLGLPIEAINLYIGDTLYSAFGRFRRLHDAWWCQFLHASCCCGCSRRAVYQGRSRLKHDSRSTGMQERNS